MSEDPRVCFVAYGHPKAVLGKSLVHLLSLTICHMAFDGNTLRSDALDPGPMGDGVPDYQAQDAKK